MQHSMLNRHALLLDKSQSGLFFPLLYTLIITIINLIVIAPAHSLDIIVGIADHQAKQ